MNQITPTSTAKGQRSIDIIFDKCVAINGITEMIESNDRQIVCNLGDRSLVIMGEKLKIVNFDVEKGICSLDGNIAALKYSKGKQKLSLLKRLFK